MVTSNFLFDNYIYDKEQIIWELLHCTFNLRTQHLETGFYLTIILITFDLHTDFIHCFNNLLQNKTFLHVTTQNYPQLTRAKKQAETKGEPTRNRLRG